MRRTSNTVLSPFDIGVPIHQPTEMPNDSDKEYWLDERHLEYHRRQFDAPYRSTVKMGEFVREILPEGSAITTAADIACGSGANIYHLSKTFPGVAWTGFDFNPKALRLGEKLIAELGGVSGSAAFQEADFFRLSEQVGKHTFDMVFVHQTLLAIPKVEEFMKQLFYICKPGGWIFLSSLFTDFLVDAEIKLHRYSEGTLEVAGLPALYIIYSLPKFEQICHNLGAKKVASKDFEIDVDLPFPTHREMGTFTRKLSDGTRIQCSGPLLMPWKFVGIQPA